MAKMILPTNFLDDIPSESMNGKRRYRLINNTDGTVSLEDVTAYDQVGSAFGSGQINATNTAVNASADAGKIIDSLDAIKATTQAGFMAGALALKQQNEKLKDFEPILDSTGKITGYKTSVGGADTVFPFNSDVRYQDWGTPGSAVNSDAGNNWYASGSKNYKFDNAKVVYMVILYKPNPSFIGATMTEIKNIYIGAFGTLKVYKLTDISNDGFTISWSNAGVGDYIIPQFFY